MSQLECVKGNQRRYQDDNDEDTQIQEEWCPLNLFILSFLFLKDVCARESLIVSFVIYASIKYNYVSDFNRQS